jgi:hypothetical protein
MNDLFTLLLALGFFGVLSSVTTSLDKWVKAKESRKNNFIILLLRLLKTIRFILVLIIVVFVIAILILK